MSYFNSPSEYWDVDFPRIIENEEFIEISIESWRQTNEVSSLQDIHEINRRLCNDIKLYNKCGKAFTRAYPEKGLGLFIGYDFSATKVMAIYIPFKKIERFQNKELTN